MATTDVGASDSARLICLTANALRANSGQDSPGGIEPGRDE